MYKNVKYKLLHLSTQSFHLPFLQCFVIFTYSMKEMLYAVRCLKSNEDMILALAGQLKQLSHEPEKFR